MGKKDEKVYFDPIFSIVITSITVLFVVGLIVFLLINFTIGVFDWDPIDTLIFGLIVFGMAITISLLLVLFGAWRYWLYDNEGITNGSIFFKKKIRYEEIEKVETKTIVIGAEPFITTQECYCFYKGKTMIFIPTIDIRHDDMCWLKEHIATMG